jgi:hypothetical protein
MRTHFVPLLIARVSFDNTIITIRRTAVDMPVRPDTVTRQAYDSANIVLPRTPKECGNTLQTFAERSLGHLREKKSSPFRVRGKVVYWSARRQRGMAQPGRANAVVM